MATKISRYVEYIYLNEADKSRRIKTLSGLVDLEGLSDLTHIETRQSICILHQHRSHDRHMIKKSVRVFVT